MGSFRHESGLWGGSFESNADPLWKSEARTESPAPQWTIQGCPRCQHTGAIPNGLTINPDICPLCKGKGAVLVSVWGTVQVIA